MGNEEPAYQALPRSVLSNCNLTNIRKQKYIGTRKHNSEAVEGTKQEHRIKDLDGSRSGHFLENIQGTTLQATGGDDECTEQPDAKVEQRGIDSPFGWRGGSGGGIVLFELLDGHITQKFVDVGRKVDGSRRPSVVGSARRRCIGRFPRGNAGDIKRPSEVGSMDLVELLCWHANATIGGA